jgi:hypothetical protein
MANGAVTSEACILGRVRGGSGILFHVPMSRPSIHPDKIGTLRMTRKEYRKRYSGRPDRHALGFDYAQPNYYGGHAQKNLSYA